MRKLKYFKNLPPLTPCHRSYKFFTRMEMSGVRSPYSSFGMLGESSAIIVFHVTLDIMV
jgi:hypothetical protein